MKRSGPGSPSQVRDESEMPQALGVSGDHLFEAGFFRETRGIFLGHGWASCRHRGEQSAPCNPDVMWIQGTLIFWRLKKENSVLQIRMSRWGKQQDKLEDHSHRNNWRLIGIPEGCEGANMVRFLHHFLPEILKQDLSWPPAEIDWAHCAGSILTRVGSSPGQLY